MSFPRFGRFVSDTTVYQGLLRLLGSTSIEWHIADGRYSAKSETYDDSGRVYAALTSEGRIDPEFGVAPERYVEKRLNRAPLATNFRWSERKVTFSNTDRELPLRPGLPDQLSFLAQLAVIAQAAGDLVEQTLAHIARGHAQKRWRIDELARRRAGRQQTVDLHRWTVRIDEHIGEGVGFGWNILRRRQDSRKACYDGIPGAEHPRHRDFASKNDSRQRGEQEQHASHGADAAYASIFMVQQVHVQALRSSGQPTLVAARSQSDGLGALQM